MLRNSKGRCARLEGMEVGWSFGDLVNMNVAKTGLKGDIKTTRPKSMMEFLQVDTHRSVYPYLEYEEKEQLR
jgi:hypothetical protein